MDSGDHTYRQLYGSGGAVDRLTALYGLGRLGADVQINPQAAQVPNLSLESYLASTGGGMAFPVGGGGNPAAQTTQSGASDCGCMTQGLGLEAAQAAQLQTVCAQDPEAFKQALRDAGHDPAALCKPWYKKPKGLALIGGGVIGVGLLAWMVL